MPPIVYSQKYSIGIDELPKDVRFEILEKYPLDILKFKKIFYDLSFEEVLSEATHLEKISDSDLELFHTKEYIQSVYTNTHVIGNILRLPLPPYVTAELMNNLFVDPIKHIISGTLYATKLALEVGWSINIGGGYHHARSDKGSGFCFFNDFAISAIKLHQSKPKMKILYIDLDAHIGDGVIEYAKSDKDFFVFDIYNTFSKHDLPIVRKNGDSKFTLIGISPYSKDEHYLSLLYKHLPPLINTICPDIIFYNGGADILIGDVLGQLSISPEAMIQRDQFVFKEAKKRGIPIMMCLSGGYGKNNYQCVSNSLKQIIALMKVLGMTIQQ